jgi:hypothetical protein
MNTTQHAEVRMQQRCIDPLIVEWAIRYGAKTHDGRGGVKRYFDKRSRKALARDVGDRVVDLLSPLLNTIVIHSATDDTIITVAHRTKRI